MKICVASSPGLGIYVDVTSQKPSLGSSLPPPSDVGEECGSDGTQFGTRYYCKTGLTCVQETPGAHGICEQPVLGSGMNPCSTNADCPADKPICYRSDECPECMKICIARSPRLGIYVDVTSQKPSLGAGMDVCSSNADCPPDKPICYRSDDCPECMKICVASTAALGFPYPPLGSSN